MTIELPRLVQARCAFVLLAALASTSIFAVGTRAPYQIATETDDPEALVEIPDGALRAAVENALGKEPDDPITRGEMATIRLLQTAGVERLTGIEYAVDLWSLELSKGDIDDLAPLAGLTALRYLWLTGHEISNLSPLAGLTSLASLNLHANEISDISPLAAMTSLTDLSLGSNEIVDMSPLSAITSLTTLRLGFNRISALSPLAGLTSLTYLYLGDNEIVDVSPLSALTELKTLNLGRNRISDVSPLAGLALMTSLDLGSNKISDSALSALAGLTSLTELNLGDNEIADASLLAAMTSLTQVNLCCNEISDASPLTGLTSLTALYLHSNEIVDASPLANLTSLTHLSLGSNEVVDVSPLADLTELKTLDLAINRISDVSPLSEMVLITSLNLLWNKISDISPLAGLTSLTSLNLYANEISDISPLAGLTSLADLYLLNNHISDIYPLVSNQGIGEGDQVDLRSNPLSVSSVETHIPTLQDRGVNVRFSADALPTEVPAAPRWLEATPGDRQVTLRWRAAISRFIIRYETRLGTGDPVAWGDWRTVAGSNRKTSEHMVTGLVNGTRYSFELRSVNALGGGEAASTATTLVENPSEEVAMPSSALREAVANQLGKDDDAKITRGEMALLSTLTVWERGIADLTGLEYAVNLVRLDLSNNDISDVSPLAGLRTLTSLDLSGWVGVSCSDGTSVLEGRRFNEISDVSPLADLTSLTRLDLDGNRVEDASALAGMTSLTSLDLSYNDISDASPLAGMTSLGSLRLGGNAVADALPLAGMTSLTNLDLSCNGISDISPLAGMTSLTSLWLSNNRISDISPLAGMTSLTSLRLSINDISDVSPLAGMASMTDLELSFNGISDISPLAGMTSLTRLGLPFNAIWDASPLTRMTWLTSLSLSYNEFFDLSPLAGLTALRYLELANIVISDLSPLVDLTSLTHLDLSRNYGRGMLDVSQLVSNGGLGPGDRVDLRESRLAVDARETHIPTLLQRGVEVLFDEVNNLPEIPDIGLRDAVEWELIDNEDFANLESLDASDRGVEALTGLEGATNLRGLFLDRNRITDISPLAGLDSLRVLTLSHNSVEDWSPLANMDSLGFLALDGNSLQEVPPLPHGLRYLYLAHNTISDIASLADMRSLREVDVSGNSITTLAPLVGMWRLWYLHVNDNQIADISPLNFTSLRELHMANNAVRDITPLLEGEELLMADVRRNPLADDALDVLETLHERRVTVLAGETVPYFPAAGEARQGFVRVVNRGDEGGHAFIEAVDDAGVRAGPVRLEIGARRAVHFNSRDLQNGNAGKGLGGGVGAPTAGDWRLSVISALDLEVLSYIRTGDGFVTAMHDVAADAMAPFFNPGGNVNQRSILRQVNMEAEPAKWTTGGYDDAGAWRPMAGSLLVRPQHALTLTAQALENDHGLGDGRGKWRLRVRGFPWFAMSLLESPTGHLTNLSTAPDNATALADGRSMHRLPLFPAAGGARQGFARVINRSYSSGEVVIEAVDDAGMRSGPVRLTLRPRRAVHFNSMDLEAGNADKGLDGGLGVGQGDWRLEITSELDLTALSYIRTADGFLTSMHDLAPVAEDGSHRVAFFNPGSNTGQASKLRLINDREQAASVSITGIDDHGSASRTVSLTVPAGSALTFTAAELEAGNHDGLAGRLGNGAGKWRLRVRSDEPIAVMSLLETPTGHLTNLSTTTRQPPRPNDQY